MKRKDFDYSLYAFGPPSGASRGRIDLDVGVNDDLNVIRFHAKEATEGRTFRWSQTSVVRHRQPDRRRRRAQLALWMSDGGRPAAAPPADVTVDD